MKKDSRFAHTDGITDIAVSSNGKIITAGNDGDVRIWNNFDDDDPISFSATDSCFGVVYSGDKVIVATEGNTVETYEFPKGKLIENKLKFTGAANHVDVSADGKFLVAGSADTTILLTTVDKATEPPKKIQGHSGPVLSVSIDPLKEFIASSGCDGHVCIWSFEDPKQQIKKWDHVFPASNDITTSQTLCRMAWHPLLGKLLAIPMKDKIVLYNRVKWEEIKSLHSSKLTKFFSVVTFSTCGSYIGGGGFDGLIVIWDAFTYTIKMHIIEMYHITGMVFAPITNELLCTDGNGRLLCIKEFSQAEEESQSQSERVSDDTNKEPRDKDDVFGDGMDDLLDDEGENAFSVSKIKADLGFVGDEYVGPVKSKKITNGADDDDDARSIASLASSKSKQTRPAAVEYNPFTSPQKPFQPASTPEHLTHRFMVWNNVGIIRSYSTDDEEFNEDAIDIEFHDATFHHAIHLQNQFDYHLANVSTEVVVLGCPKSADNCSKLLCINFASWDASRSGEWTIDFPKGEEVTCIAVGTGWVAAATTENRLRVYSIGGIQKFVYNFAGAIVALSGHENLLFITYHHGIGINGNQSISFSILKMNADCSRLTPLVSDSLPVSRGSTLSWVGFTDEGSPVFSDTSEMLQILNGRLWTTFCDMRENLSGPNDHFWVVGVSECSLHVRAVKCKSAKYPPTLPRPTIMMLDAKIPLCELDTEKSQLENSMLLNFLLASTTRRMAKKGYDIEENKDEAEAKSKETLFKLFAMSCNNNRNFRAAEYVSMMPTAHSMQLAMKYASKLDKKALTERLQAIGRRKLYQEDQGDEEEFDDFEFSQVVTHMDYRSFVPNDNDSFTSEIRSSSSNGVRSKEVIPITPVADNPLMKKQKEEIRSIINSNSSFRNPFKKDKDKQPNNTLTRMSSFTASLNDSPSMIENSDSQDGSDLNTSKGMSKIDVWKKPSEKHETLPEFNPKDPNRKSLSTGNKKKIVFEKKVKESNGKEGTKKQRTVFDMFGKKSNPGSPLAAVGNPEESENTQDISDKNGTHESPDDADNASSTDGSEKKRKRLDELENSKGIDNGKKSKI